MGEYVCGCYPLSIDCHRINPKYVCLAQWNSVGKILHFECDHKTKFFLLQIPPLVLLLFKCAHNTRSQDLFSGKITTLKSFSMQKERIENIKRLYFTFTTTDTDNSPKQSVRLCLIRLRSQHRRAELFSFFIISFILFWCFSLISNVRLIPDLEIWIIGLELPFECKCSSNSWLLWLLWTDWSTTTKYRRVERPGRSASELGEKPPKVWKEVKKKTFLTKYQRN